MMLSSLLDTSISGQILGIDISIDGSNQYDDSFQQVWLVGFIDEDRDLI